MAHANGSPDTLEKHQHEVCSAFARAAVAMRDAAHTAENFSVWFSRVNNLQNVPVPPMFNGSYNFAPQFAGPQQQQQSSEPEQTGKKRKASGDQEGKRKRTVKEKKPHDPNAPKRPPSAYLLFQNEVRKTVKGQYPDMPYGQVLAEISKLWHALTPDERAPYMQATADSKVIYEKAKANYDALSPTEAKEGKEVLTKPSASKSKTPAASSVAVDKPAPKATTTSDDEDEDEEDESASSTSDKSSDDNDDNEEEEVPEPVPEPPRKKYKKEAVKAPTPPSAKVDKKKKKNEEGKKKK